jgi:ATP-dependent RNA helicase DBP3
LEFDLSLGLTFNMAASETGVSDVHEKKSRKSKAKADSTAEDAVMVNGDSGETTKKDKKKRKKSSDVDAEDQPSLGKAERKRRKKDAAAAAAAAAAADAAPEGVLEEDGAVAESKEERKKRKKEKRAQREALAQSTAQNGMPATIATATLPTPPATASTSSLSTPSPSEVSAYLSKNNITIHSPAGDATPILKFAQLASYGVDEQLIKATDKFKEPSFIQACSWPASLKGSDVVGIAETGR